MCKLLDFLSGLFASSPYKEGGLSGEIPSPRVAIRPENIIYDPIEKTVLIKDVLLVSPTDVGGTNSMEPAIDIGHRVLISSGSRYMSMEVIKLGDVILYKATWGYPLVIHSVIEVGQDSLGWFCKAKGWNVKSEDPQIIREDQITHVALGVIWTGEETES